MTAWLVGVLLTVLENEKVQAMIRTLFDDAVATLQNTLESHLDELEKNVLDKLDALPAKLLGEAEHDVGTLLHEITGTKDDIAGAVKGEVQPLFTPLVDLLKNLPGGGILGTILGR